MGSTVNQREAGQAAPGVPRKAIESLAQELNLPVEQVERVYREQSAAIGTDARIKQFVPVLVTRSVRSELRRRQGGA